MNSSVSSLDYDGKHDHPELQPPSPLIPDPLEPPRAARKAKPLSEQSKTCLHRTDSSSLEVRVYEAGEFEWRVDTDQTSSVLEGFAEVELADGRRMHLRPGTSMFLPRGMHGRWRIHERLRVVSVCDYRLDNAA